MIELYFKKATKSAPVASTSGVSSVSGLQSDDVKPEMDMTSSPGEIQLTRDQQVCLQEILDFVTDPKRKRERLLLLTGSAGTGKTFLVSYIYRILSRNYNIVFTASTNKAINVLEATFEAMALTQKKEVQTDSTHTVGFYTIHKFMNSKRAISRNGETYFEFSARKRPDVNKADIVFVDEVSMIPAFLASQMEQTKRLRKIIFIGDRAQLPPVGEAESCVFGWPISKCNLNEIVRYRNNIVQLADQMKALIFHKKPIRIRDCAGDGVHLFRDKATWMEEYYTLHKKERSIVILAYTNEETRTLNLTIRSHLYGKRLVQLSPFEPSETIMFNNYYLARSAKEESKDADEDTTKYYTSMQVQIRSCVPKRIEIDYSSILSVLRTDLTTREAPIDALGGLEKELPPYIDVYQVLTEHDAIANYPVDYADYQSRMETVKAVFSNMRSLFTEEAVMRWWEFYYEAMIDPFCDISYGYCMTVHKSQGSTFDHVFIQMNDIATKNPKERESYQCLYTAITRASKAVYVYY